MWAQLPPPDVPISPDAVPLDGWFTSVARFFTVVYPLFVIWMVVECFRKDPDRGIWLWVILIFHPFGPIIYALVRWLPNADIRLPAALRVWTQGRELNRLQSAALQIGNPHHYIQLGDALRDAGQTARAGEAYAQALAKEPDNIQALWGAALVDLRLKNYATARGRLENVLKIDPQYKFGDVSLALGKTLYSMGEKDRAAAHLDQHIRRWRHPEALFLLATVSAERGEIEQARSHLRALLLDLQSSPHAIARRHGFWKSQARRLLRRLSRKSTA